MTTALLVRLDKEQAARLKSAARKRSTTRTAIVREALDKYLAAEKRPDKARTRKNQTNSSTQEPDWDALGVPPTEPGKGVGWAKHFEWLERHGRRVKGRVEDEIRELDRDRGFK